MPRVVKLDGRGAQLVQLLEDLGHLSQDDADRLCVGVADLLADQASPGVAAGRPDLPGHRVQADASVVRRAAAMLLFGLDGEPPGAVEDDWSVLFS